MKCKMVGGIVKHAVAQGTVTSTHLTGASWEHVFNLD
jgi:hypothetical protein